MSSGAVLLTSSSTICGPEAASKAASLDSSAARWLSASVPVWSITRADSAGTGCTSCAGASVAPSRAHRTSSQRIAAVKGFYLEAAAAGAAGAGLSKLTVGGTLIAASFCTVKLGLT